MQFYTVAGAVILAFCGLEGAKRLNRNMDGEIAYTEAFIALLRYVRGQIDCYALPIGDIFSRCDRELLSTCGWQGELAPRSFDELMPHCFVSDGEAKSAIVEFVADFGKNYREEQLKRCDGCISCLERARDRLVHKARERKRLNFTICLCSSLALIILLV